jgi:hypothetical protein
MRRSVSFHALIAIKTYKGCPDENNKQGRINATYLFICSLLNNVRSGEAGYNLGGAAAMFIVDFRDIPQPL